MHPTVMSYKHADRLGGVFLRLETPSIGITPSWAGMCQRAV